jgi:hypothetical protein
LSATHCLLLLVLLLLLLLLLQPLAEYSALLDLQESPNINAPLKITLSASGIDYIYVHCGSNSLAWRARLKQQHDCDAEQQRQAIEQLARHVAVHVLLALQELQQQVSAVAAFGLKGCERIKPFGWLLVVHAVCTVHCCAGSGAWRRDSALFAAVDSFTLHVPSSQPHACVCAKLTIHQ